MSEELESEEFEILNQFVDPTCLRTSIPSLVKFLKLVQSSGLTVRVQIVSIRFAPTRYAAKSKPGAPVQYAMGDVKKDGYVRFDTHITATDMEHFGVLATWHGELFKQAFIGGQDSGHAPAKLFTQSTKALEEIKRCLSK